MLLGNKVRLSGGCPPRTGRGLRTFYGQLLFWATILVGALGLVIFRIETEALTKQTKIHTQRIYWNRAAVYVNELAPALGNNFDEAKLQQLLLRLQKMHPRDDFYVLNADGSIRMFVPDPLVRAAPKHPKVNAVNLKPLTSFLEQPSLPRKGGILGTDPFEPNVAKAFIASRIFLGDAPGYLYVVFGKSGNRMGVPLAYRPWYYPWVAIISGIILVVGLFYILLFRRPVRMILTALKQITAGKLNERVPICGGNELAEIGENINQMADTIEATVSELRRTDRLQREMTAALCHDFGTPLFGAQAYLDQVINGRTWLSAAEQEERLSVAARNLTKLRELVSSFFELSKLDSRNLTPALEPFSVLDLVTEELVPKLKPLAESKHVTLRTEYDDGLPRVVGDMALIDRALTNLIINAINYNRPGGEVVIALNKKNGKVQLEVRDDGIGMKAEDIPFVFDRFFRSDQSRSTITGGSGLGLAIVKKILEAHDEEISVESLIDKGSKFTFSLKSYSAAGN